MSDASQTVVLFVYASLFLLLIILVIILLVFLTRHKARNYQLKLQEVQQAFEQELMKIKLELQEEVLTKISGEIHDHIGQVFSGVALALQSLDAEALSDRGKNIIDGSVQRILSGTEELRNLSHLMSGAKVEQLGLVEALKRELSFLSLNRTLHISYNYADREILPALNGSVNLLLFRVAQEAVRNVFMHSSADQLNVSITYDHNKQVLIMEIHDNGLGFSEGAADGIGINNMRQRARLLGAKFDISSNQPHGTVVSVKLKI